MVILGSLRTRLGVGDRGSRTGVERQIQKQALAEAKRLTGQGRADEAVAFLTGVNRAGRNRRLERRLIELRFAGAESQAFTDAPPPWPDSVPDLFPGQQIPDIGVDDLGVDQLRSAIANHGSLLVRGLVPAETVARLRDDIDRAFAAYDAIDEGGSVPPELEGWFDRCAGVSISERPLKRKRGAVLTLDSPPTLFDLIEAFEAAGIRRLLSDYFGELPMLLGKKATLRRVSHEFDPGSFIRGWHQDGAFMGPGIRSINIWLSLSHCGDTAPGLDVVGRRLDGLVETGEDGGAAWGISDQNAEKVAGPDVVRPLFEPGDALLFDHLNMHCTAIDPGMIDDRYAIETWFLSPSTYGAMLERVGSGYQPRDQLPILY